MAPIPASLSKLRGTVGVWTSTHESLAANEAGEIASELEGLGYSAMWVPEAWGRESFTNAGLLLSGSSTITVGTSIANIWARDAVSAANASKTLNAAYQDRFVLGLGVSHQPLVENLRGHTYVTPFLAMKAYLEAMDAAPMFSAEGTHEYPRVIAALGPKMLELGATLANGVLPYLVTPEHTAFSRTIIGDSFLGVEQAVVLGQDREEYLRRAHEHLEIYTGLDNYRNSWRRQGFDDEDFVRGGSERLCEAMVVHGDESAVVARIREHQAAGADHVCLQVLGADMGVVPRDEWHRLALSLDA
jgi:probable F420-dependent oxidoreductase